MMKRASLESALRLSPTGIPVFPCRPKDETVNGKLRKAKSPITTHGHNDATTDEAQIRDHWRRRPDALIGVPTGKASGIFVIDVDPDGMEWYEQNKHQLGDPRVHRTRRGGYHLLYRHPEGSGFTVGVKQIADGIDHRGDGGYIIWWPAHGGEIEHKKGLRKLDDLPGWLLDRLIEVRKRSKPKANGAHSKPNGVDRIEEGGRNDALTRLAGRMRRDGATQSQLEAALTAYNDEQCHPPLDRDEVQGIAASVARYEPELADSRHDWGNAERLAALAKDDVRYEPRQRTFYAWGDTRWRMDDGAHMVSKLAVQSAQRLLDDAMTCPDSARKKDLLNWYRASLNENRIKGAVELLKNFTGLHVQAAKLDADPFLLGVSNGVLDLRTGKLCPSDRGQLITRVAGCGFDPKARCPQWLRFLDTVMAGDAAMITYLQELAGYTLSGDTSGQMLMFLYGTGQNGKSVFIEIIRDVLGDYGMSMRTEALSLKAMASKNGPSEDVARLMGARMVTVNETAEGMRFDEALIKDLTGEDTVAARYLHKGTFEFRPAFKIWIRGNHQPEFNGADGGMARRVRLIPFDVRISDDDKDPQLKLKLRGELPGILNWAVDGCLRWQKSSSIETPKKVLDATKDYLEDMDGLAEFFESVLIRDKKSWTPVLEIFQAYQQWASYQEGIRMPLTKHKLSLRLKGRGFKPVKDTIEGKQVRGYFGVRVKSAFSRIENAQEGLI